ncbi:MAG: helix-hairpin-helix domain-containing protein [Nitrospirae bacterium]|nr:helix-hairpin-helix domain-containing protein [Nitrospirota bacterium]
MMKKALTVSYLLLLLSISAVQPCLVMAEAAAPVSKGEMAVLNVNAASADDMAAIPGLGEKKSQAIVKFREKHGPFVKVEDLKKVDGIGDKLFGKIKPYFTVKTESAIKAQNNK